MEHPPVARCLPRPPLRGLRLVPGVTPLPPAWTHAALRDPTQDPATEPRGSVR